jgi:toxin ParE1/3/4
MQTAWTDPLLERVNEIAVCIARDDPHAAARRTEELFDAVARLADFPESGRTVPEPGARHVCELIFGAYRVFYRVGLDTLPSRDAAQRLCERLLFRGIYAYRYDPVESTRYLGLEFRRGCPAIAASRGPEGSPRRKGA